MAGFSIVVFMLILMTIYIAIVAIVAFVYYILTAIAVYKIAKRRGVNHAFLAWIPIAQTYLYAKLIGTNVKIGSVTIPRFPWIYLVVINLGGVVLNYIETFTPFSLITFLEHVMEYSGGQTSSLDFATLGGTIAGFILLILFLAVRIFTMYRVFSLFKGNAILLTVLGAVIPFAEPIILLVLSGKPLVEGPQEVFAA
jgi:hypothetical protein